jgi:hypothetical protein
LKKPKGVIRIHKSKKKKIAHWPKEKGLKDIRHQTKGQATITGMNSGTPEG